MPDFFNVLPPDEALQVLVQQLSPVVHEEVLATAQALDLAFIELLKKQYDLVIPKANYESEHFQPILSLIRSEKFRRDVEALGAYDTTTLGRVAA